jgi:hypothetical protein
MKNQAKRKRIFNTFSMRDEGEEKVNSIGLMRKGETVKITLSFVCTQRICHVIKD